MSAYLLHTLTFFGLAVLIFGTAAGLERLWRHCFPKKEMLSEEKEEPEEEDMPDSVPDDEPFPQCLVKKHNFLVHFTRAENLDSILRYGLIPRDNLEMLAPRAILPDPADSLSQDHDNRSYTVHLSLEFPDDRLFALFRHDAAIQGQGEDPWCVLLLDTGILAEKDCLFCAHGTSHPDIWRQADSMLMTGAAYRAMFADGGKRPASLPPNHPTDVQAEILVAESIEPRHILYFAFNDEERAALFRQRHPYCQTILNPYYFRKRDTLYPPRS